MEPKMILCWGAGTWAKLLAWIEIVIGILTFIMYVMDLAELGYVDTTILAPEDLIAHETLVALAWASLATSFVYFAMGVLLLFGVNMRKMSYLDVWMVVTGIFIVVNIFVAAWVYQVQGVAQLLRVIIGIIISSFQIWTVQIFKRGIRQYEENSGRSSTTPEAEVVDGYQSLP